MADGKVVIDVILDDGQVAKGVVNIDRRLNGITTAGKRAAAGIKEMVTALGLVAVASKAIDAVKNSLDRAIARYDTLKGFPVVMQQMGFSAEQAQKSIDKLAQGIDGLPTTLDSIVANTQRIALLTGDLDLATETALALNNAFLASGSSSADAERGLTQYVQMLSKGKVDMQSWTTLQETMGYALRETAAAFGFAGDSAQNDLYAALQSGTVTFDEFNAKLIELSNATGGFADIAKNSTSGIATSFSNMRNAVVKGVTNVIDAIDEALGGTGTIASYLDKVKVGINQVFDWIVSAIPLVAAAIRSVKEALDPWIPSFTEVSNIIQNLLGGAIAFVQQAFANLVNVWQQNGQSILSSAITFFTGVWNTVQTAFTGIYNVISDVLGSRVLPFVQEQLANLQQFWQENGKQIMQAVQNAFQFIQKVIEIVMPAIKFVIEIVWSAIQDIISGALNVIMGLIQVFTGIFTGDWDQLWEGIKKILSGAIDLIMGIMSLNFLGGIRKVLVDLGKKSVQIVKNMWDDIVKFFKTFTDDAASKVSSMGSKVWSFAKEMATNFKNTIINLKDDIVRKFQEIKDGIIDKVKSIDLREIGKDIIRGLINGIGSMASAVVDKVKEIGSGIINGFKNVLNIHSPSRVMVELGKFVGQGLSKGIESTKKENEKAIEEVGQVIVNAASDIQKEITKIEKEAEKERKKIQEDYANKRMTLKKKTLESIQKLEREEAEKIAKINEKAQSDILKIQEKADSEKLKAIQNFIKQKKDLDELSLADEVRIWEESLKHFKDGTDEKIEAQIAYKNALKALNDETVKINQEYSNKISEVLETHKKKEQELTETYTKAVEDRTKALTNFASLFDEFDYKTTKSGTKLLKNLESQVEGFKKWQEEIEKLSQRAIDEGLLEELRQMGPKALPEIAALNKLTDEQLSKYSDLYKEKSELARQQAVKELEVMRADTQKQIFALHVQTANQLTQLQNEWQKKIKEVRTGTNDELGQMKDDLKTIGEQSIQGMIKGLEAMEPALMRKARSIANAVKREIEKALDIHSPSRWMRDHIGKNMVLGWIEGIDREQSSILRKSEQMANWMKPSIPEGFTNRLRGVSVPLGNIFPGNVSNVSHSNTSIKNDHSKHINVQVQGGSNERQIARQTEKTIRRMIFQMG